MGSQPNTRKTRHILHILALTLTALLATACGGNDSNNNSGPSDTGFNNDTDTSLSDTNHTDDVDTTDSGDSDTDSNLPDFEWPVPTAPITIAPHESWKERIEYFDDPFIAGTYNDVRWVKFSVLMADPSRVIFQNSHTYPFHYHFAAERLAPFSGMSHAEFDNISLYENGQQVISGAVLFPPVRSTNEIGIQLVRQDAYHPEMVKIVHDLVKSSIDEPLPQRITPFYFPTFEQTPSTIRWADAYQQRNVTVSSVERWMRGNACYSHGWAYGRLVHIPGDQIDAAYRDGTLLHTDILLTDAVPAEVPHVAGIISLTAGVPNSHVAILATSFQIPYVFLRNQADRLQAQELVGSHIVIRTRSNMMANQSCSITMANAQSMPDDVLDAITDAKKTAPIHYAAKQHAGHYAVPTDTLMPADIVRYGGKAANFGMIRRAIPDNSPQPVPMAFSFDLWDEFLEQTMPGGKTLRAEISERLAPFSSYPPQIDALDDALTEIRDLFTDEATFTPAQITGILAALQGFDDLTTIRFRSSTNLEDAENFTGAGLYKSNTGCKADDLDDDETGPSLCDPDRAKERGILRAIRHTFASFYNTNAYLERLRHGVDESEIGMAMLVHYSDPDPTEMANGVITLKHTTNTNNTDLTIVTQPGAASVTNPSDNANPEIVTGLLTNFGNYFNIEQYSELLPIAQTTLEWNDGDNDEYFELSQYILAVIEEFKSAHPAKSVIHLDLEYKKLKPGKIIVRQVREIPTIDPNATTTPILIASPQKLCVLQGEVSNVFGIHRNKLQWDVNMRTTVLTPAMRSFSLLTEINGDMMIDDQKITVQNSPATWDNAAFHSTENETTDSFSIGNGPAKRDYKLIVDVPSSVRVTNTPIVFPGDFSYRLEVHYSTPQPTIEFFEGISKTSEDYLLLTPCTDQNTPTATVEPRTIDLTFGPTYTATTSYWWPPGPTGITAGYTAPLVRFDKTTIDNLTTDPIVLKDFYSQTYRPQHHNFSEDFYFDFLLEPTLSEESRTELRALDIRALIYTQDEPYAVGFDGAVRPLSHQSF